MKRLFSLMIALVPALWAGAQTMYVYQDRVITTVQATQAGDMTYSDNTLTIEGESFPLSEVDSIVFDNKTLQADSVIVSYNGTDAQVYVPVEVRKYLTVTVDGAHVTIVSSQTETDGDNEIKYALTGTATDGSFCQDGSYKCTLYLNGVNLTSSQGAAINLKNGKRIDVYVPDGTTNTLADCANGTQSACFRIKGHAEFRGGGTLNIAGNTNHAYKSNEYTILKKTFTGLINVTSAVSDGMHVSQYFEMNGGNVVIKGAKGDGIQADITNDLTDENNGQMFLNGGSVNITLTGDNAGGIKVDDQLTVTGGTFVINMSGNNSDGVTCNTARITADSSAPTFTITHSGGTLVVGADKKRSSCFKTTDNMYFLAGTITANVTAASSEKTKGIKVGNNYYYTSTAKTNVTPDVSGSMIYYVE
ncbi:MAG: carbohydrate-binding domain-containing protein [Bacteroidaceae bacterium]|nr:carbohydrate-binding domain-containing protein [Bacteroidaceae bacterium]